MDRKLLIPTEIIKSKRKTLSLIIKNNGDFIVRAPLKIKDIEIKRFITQKADWITKKRIEILNKKLNSTTFENLEYLHLLGQKYEIAYADIAKVKIEEGKLILPKVNSKEELKTFLKKYAKKYLVERVNNIAKNFDFNYTSVSISSAKTCWGSCGFNNKLHFTYKLMLCPLEVVNYIIIHELCHTIIKNHSRKFWDLVRLCCPDYILQEKWLKENKGIIDII